MRFFTIALLRAIPALYGRNCRAYTRVFAARVGRANNNAITRTVIFCKICSKMQLGYYNMHSAHTSSPRAPATPQMHLNSEYNIFSVYS